MRSGLPDERYLLRPIVNHRGVIATPKYRTHLADWSELLVHRFDVHIVNDLNSFAVMELGRYADELKMATGTPCTADSAKALQSALESLSAFLMPVKWSVDAEVHFLETVVCCKIVTRALVYWYFGAHWTGEPLCSVFSWMM